MTKATSQVYGEEMVREAEKVLKEVQESGHWTTFHVFQVLRMLVAYALGVDQQEVHMHSRLVSELGADTKDFLDMRWRINQAFGCTSSDDEVSQMETVRDLYCAVCNALELPVSE